MTESRIPRVVVALLAAIVLGAVPASGATPLKIYAVHSYPDAPWSHDIEAGVRSWLAHKRLDFSLTTHRYLNYRKQLVSKNAQRKEVAHLLNAIAKENPDFILVSDDEAVMTYLPALYATGRKIVFTGVNREAAQIPDLERHRDRVTGVFERYPIDHSLKLLRDLAGPKAGGSIAVITSLSDSSLAIAAEVERYFASRDGIGAAGFTLRKMYRLGTWREWQKAIEEINHIADAVWILVPFSVKDSALRNVPLLKMGEWLLPHIKVPSLSLVDLRQHYGSMASMSVTPQSLGEGAARLMAANVLDGKPVSKLAPVVLDRCEMVINIDHTDAVGLQIPIEILEYATAVRTTSSRDGAKP